MIAIDLYLGTHPEDLEFVIQTQRAWLGETVPNELEWTDTDWHADDGLKAGINRRNATIEGHAVDGIMPEEQRRTGDLEWPAPQGTYPWAGLQGVVAAHVLLDRAGLVPFDAGDDAIVRALRWLFEENDGNGPPSNGGLGAVDGQRLRRHGLPRGRRFRVRPQHGLDRLDARSAGCRLTPGPASSREEDVKP